MKQSFKGFFSAILLLSVTFLSFAQTGREKAFSPYSRIGGIYHSYESDSVSNYRRTPAPEGYKPFYISHFGRHGSRWLASEPEYSKVHVDKVFLATAGISLKSGLTYPSISDICVKRAMIESGDEIFVLADSSKIGSSSFASLGAMSLISHIITDKEISKEKLNQFKEFEVDFIIAD
jgi:Transcriptional regulators of sugar metabolism